MAVPPNGRIQTSIKEATVNLNHSVTEKKTTFPYLQPSFDPSVKEDVNDWQYAGVSRKPVDYRRRGRLSWGGVDTEQSEL